MATMANWERDEGYSGSLTARKDVFAICIAGPEYTDDGTWMIQVYNEADENAMDYGDTVCEIENLPDEDTAKEVAERLFF